MPLSVSSLIALLFLERCETPMPRSTFVVERDHVVAVGDNEDGAAGRSDHHTAAVA